MCLRVYVKFYSRTSSTEALSGPCSDDAALLSRDSRLSARLAMSARLPDTRVHDNVFSLQCVYECFLLISLFK